MRRGFWLIALTSALTTILTGPAAAFDFEPVAPLDVKVIDPALLTNVFGAWEIRDKSGKRRCRVELKQESGVGGYQIEVAPGCAKTFPIMADISAWRLLQGWSIDLVDPLRKTRVRFETPDNRFIALGDKDDIAGIDEIVKVRDKPAPRTK
jgi:hypothetical protein